MPIVNIRDDDGNIVDSVNIPVSGGGGGGNYAPADAIVETSPLDEWYGYRNIIDDRPYIFECWKWERRIDGTFSMRGVFSMLIYYPESEDDGYAYDIMYGNEIMPFNVYDITSSSVGFTNMDDTENIAEVFNTLDFDIHSVYSGELDGGSFTDLFVNVFASDETYEKMRDREMLEACALVTINVTGKWRVD